MFSTTAIRAFSSTNARLFSTNLPKVAVIGAAGGIGQPLSLLLKNSPAVGDLSVYDLHATPGIAADLSHINTAGKVTGYAGKEQLGEALTGCKAVVIPAGVPRKPGMTRDDLFNTNANIVKECAEACAKYCPDAFLLIISNPVNSTVPIVAETLKKHGVYDPKKLFGVTTLDVTRANTFVSELKGLNVDETNVTVVGGHAGTTILPVLSGLETKFSEEELAALTKRIQFGGDEVVQAKDGAGSATLSMAVAGARFTERLLEAASGKKNVVECSYVESPVAAKDGAKFFSTQVTLGPNGVEEIHPLPALSPMEQANYETMVVDLGKQIKKGEDFVASN